MSLSQSLHSVAPIQWLLASPWLPSAVCFQFGHFSSGFWVATLGVFPPQELSPGARNLWRNLCVSTHGWVGGYRAIWVQLPLDLLFVPSVHLSICVFILFRTTLFHVCIGFTVCVCTLWVSSCTSLLQNWPRLICLSRLALLVTLDGCWRYSGHKSMQQAFHSYFELHLCSYTVLWLRPLGVVCTVFHSPDQKVHNKAKASMAKKIQFQVI